MGMMDDKYDDFSMLDLFRMETENHCSVLTDGLLELENNPSATDLLESLMRTAHSIKGAARIVDLEPALKLAHTMEDIFVAAQRGELVLNSDHIDVLLQGVDMFGIICELSEHDGEAAVMDRVEKFVQTLKAITHEGQSADDVPPDEAGGSEEPEISAAPVKEPFEEPLSVGVQLEEITRGRSLKIAAENMNRLMWLAGESVVASCRLPVLSSELLHLKCRQADLLKLLDDLREIMGMASSRELVDDRMAAVRQKAIGCYQLLTDCFGDIEDYSCHVTELSQRLYREVLSSRMRPFSDAMKAFPRMVRDLSRSLGKKVRLEVVGRDTLVDRDVLEKLDAPLTHLLSNAVDHGIEPPEQRVAQGKPEKAVIRVEAFHKSGKLYISVIDDGRGVDLEKIRRAVVARKMVAEDVARELGEAELLEFLFLPNFTTKECVTRVSGRGVGLDVVRSMVQEIHGTVYAESKPGKGTRFELVLPLNLSVVRTLLVEIGGDLYAFPIAQIGKAVKVPRHQVEELEGRQYFTVDEQRIALISAAQVMEQQEANVTPDELCVIVINDRYETFGLLVRRFIGVQELAVQPLDSRLGKVQDIAAAAILDDGSPVLIVDVEDMIRSVKGLISQNRLKRVEDAEENVGGRHTKRILVVDDSITVREVERRLLTSKGYDVDVAVDGMDGWNAVRRGSYDLVITDIDMPRMDGIELVRVIKADSRLGTLPVMIVSYKDREEDRNRGLNAGADYYLTKGSFHDETLVTAVTDLIGTP